jgi:hypothetical protein
VRCCFAPSEEPVFAAEHDRAERLLRPAEAAGLFKIHPAPCRGCWRGLTPNSGETSTPFNSESDTRMAESSISSCSSLCSPTIEVVCWNRLYIYSTKNEWVPRSGRRPFPFG